jgi:exosortase/archaeosortase family protein
MAAHAHQTVWVRGGAGRYRSSRGSARRRLPVLLDLLIAVGICLVGFRYGAELLQVHEARWVAMVLRLVGSDSVSGTVPGHILLFRADGEIINAEVTASCSSILAILGLTALTAVVLRGRRQHAVAGLVVAVAALFLLNHLRLVMSALAGLWWGDSALVLFHDWVGTVWNMAATLGGFLLMVYVTLPTAERAEQDVVGRHTARRPDDWARPGLGYRATDHGHRALRGRTLTGLVHRYLLPPAASRWLAARREAGRIDYRIGHLPAVERAERVRALAADGLGVHTASLVAVATYDDDPYVLDCLAEAVAARQWEPVTGARVAALRLWARGWVLSRSGRDPAAPLHPHPDPSLAALAAAREDFRMGRTRRDAPDPPLRSFARPTPPALPRPHPDEDDR